jgi:hypothetical protein
MIKHLERIKNPKVISPEVTPKGQENNSKEVIGNE